VMEFDPYSVKHIRLAKNKNIGQNDLNKITVWGNSIAEVKSKFNVPFFKPSKLLGAIFLERLLPFLKNLGFDVSSITQRLERLGRPYPEFKEHCAACGKCTINCPSQAISFLEKNKPRVDKKKCIKCYVCDEVCLHNNIRISPKHSADN